MKRFFWNKDRPPSLREYPEMLLRVAVFGALVGPVGTAAFALLFLHPTAAALRPFWKFVFVSAYCGSVSSVAFYTACRLPWFYLSPLMGQYSVFNRRIISGVVGALGGMLGFTVSSGLIALVPGVNMRWAGHFGATLAFEALAGAVIALVIGSIRHKLQEGKLRESALAEAAAKAQATALQAQINPHFFFNTLNTLSALIPMDQEAALDVVSHLADMFRYTLACSQAEKVTLDQELAFVGNYLKLEQARFSRRLQVAMPEGDFHDILLPGLSLQPLVENAIRHSIAHRIEGGRVEIAVHRNGKTCSVDVFSPGDKPVTADFFREGHALANVRDRLRLHAGAAADVAVAPGGGDRLRVSLVLPL